MKGERGIYFAINAVGSVSGKIVCEFGRMYDNQSLPTLAEDVQKIRLLNPDKKFNLKRVNVTFKTAKKRFWNKRYSYII